nr:hypothetical protein BgiMline_010770 [Biomphalaria glabrata]
MAGESSALCLIIFLLLCIYMLFVMWVMSIDVIAFLRPLQNNEAILNVGLIVVGLMLMCIGSGCSRCLQPDDDVLPDCYEDVDGSVILDFDMLATVMTKKDFPLLKRRPKFDWRNVQVVCDPPIYKGGADAMKRSTRVLYTRAYTNPGKTAVAHPVHICRATVSTVEVFILRTFVINKVMRMQFGSMKSASGANFDPEIAEKLNLHTGLIRTAHFDQNWEVHTEVSVPPNSKVTIQLEVEEEIYEGEFELLSKMIGNVRVLEGKKEIDAWSSLRDFTSVVCNEGLSKDEDGHLNYLSRGIIKYLLVLGHTVNMLEKPLGKKQDRNTN